MFSVEMLAIAGIVFGVCFFFALGFALSSASLSDRADALSAYHARELARTKRASVRDARQLTDLTIPAEWEREHERR